MALNVSNFTDRLGNLFAYAEQVRELNYFLYLDYLTSLTTDFDGSGYQSTIANLQPLGNIQTGIANTMAIPLYQGIQASITDFIIKSIQNGEGIYDGTLPTALRTLRDVMVANTKSFRTVNTSSITYTATSGNQGNGTVLVTAYRPASSTVFLQEMFHETIKGECIQGGNVSNFGSATFTLTGLNSLAKTNMEYPRGDTDITIYGGSGLKTNITCTSASVTSSNGSSGVSLLSNGDFESWSSNTPTNWTIVTGTAGTQVTQGTTPARGASALQFVGDGSTLTRIRQLIASSNGAPSSVSAETNYCIMFQAKVAAAATGTVLVALRDAAGTVVGTAITLNLATLTTTYAIKSVAFSVARGSLPTTLYLDIYSTTAIQSAKTLMIDELIFAPMIPLYAGGPSVIAYSGSTDWNKDDKFSIAVVSNTSDGAGGYNGKFMKNFKRWCQTEALGIYLPVSATPTEADTKITL